MKLAICLARLIFWLRKKMGNTKDYRVIVKVLENELVSEVRRWLPLRNSGRCLEALLAELLADGAGVLLACGGWRLASC